MSAKDWLATALPLNRYSELSKLISRENMFPMLLKYTSTYCDAFTITPAITGV